MRPARTKLLRRFVAASLALIVASATWETAGRAVCRAIVGNKVPLCTICATNTAQRARPPAPPSAHAEIAAAAPAKRPVPRDAGRPPARTSRNQTVCYTAGVVRLGTAGTAPRARHAKLIRPRPVKPRTKPSYTFYYVFTAMPNDKGDHNRRHNPPERRTELA